MGLLDNEIAKWKRAFGLLGEVKLANDPGVKQLVKSEGNLYDKSAIYKSMKDAVTAPIRAYRGEIDPWSAQGVEEAVNLAGVAQLGGIPGGARGPGSVGMIDKPWFIKDYIGKLKEISPQQPERWYQSQAERNYDMAIAREAKNQPQRPRNALGQEIPPTQYGTGLLDYLLGTK